MFAPDYAPEEIKEIAQKLRKKAGLPDEPLGVVANPGNGGMASKIKDKLRLGTAKALRAPDVVESMKQGGFEPGTFSIAEADAFIRAEHKRWGEVIRAAGIQPQ